MEWLSEYDKTRRSSWTFVSFSGLTLLLKDELSFAVLYAECRVDGLSVDPEKVIDAAAFDFSKDEKVSFRCESELSSGQKRMRYAPFPILNCVAFLPIIPPNSVFPRDSEARSRAPNICASTLPKSSFQKMR